MKEQVSRVKLVKKNSDSNKITLKDCWPASGAQENLEKVLKKTAQK